MTTRTHRIDVTFEPIYGLGLPDDYPYRRALEAL